MTLENKRAFVTGATGFVGHHLTKKLILNAWEVHALIREHADSKTNKDFPAEVIQHNYSGTSFQLKEIMSQVKPDVVFHLAAFTQTDHEPKDIELLIDTNIKLGIYLLEAMRQTSVCHMVNTGTYWQHYNGTDAFRPVNLYAATKQAFEDILEFYRDAGFVRAVTLKLFDVYGPYDTRNKLLQLIKQSQESEKPLEMTMGKQIVNMVYIDDVIDAYLHAADLIKSKTADTLQASYAIGSEEEYTLREVVQTVEQVVSKKLNIKWGTKPYRKREIMMPWKGRPLPGWRAKTNLETGLRLTLSQPSFQSALVHE